MDNDGRNEVIEDEDAPEGMRLRRWYEYPFEWKEFWKSQRFLVPVGILSEVYHNSMELWYIFSYPHLNGFFAFFLVFVYSLPHIWLYDEFTLEREYWKGREVTLIQFLFLQ